MIVLPTLVILFSFCCVALLYRINSIEHIEVQSFYLKFHQLGFLKYSPLGAKENFDNKTNTGGLYEDIPYRIYGFR